MQLYFEFLSKKVNRGHALILMVLASLFLMALGSDLYFFTHWDEMRLNRHLPILLPLTIAILLGMEMYYIRRRINAQTDQDPLTGRRRFFYTSRTVWVPSDTVNKPIHKYDESE